MSRYLLGEGGGGYPLSITLWFPSLSYATIIILRHKFLVHVCCLLGHWPSVLNSVAQLCTADDPVATVLTLTPSFFSPPFFCFRNPKHTNFDSSWRNLDDLRT